VRGYLPGVPDLVPGDRAEHVPNPVALITRLPAILQEDELLAVWLSAFDDVIAPVYATLDNLDAYVRPAYAPVDFLEWLAGWVDVEIDESWTEAQRRRIVADAVSLHRRAGTAGGIRDAMQLVAGPAASVVVEESGGTAWSEEPGGKLPGSASAAIAISITVPEGDPVQLEARLQRAAATLVPAHVPTRIEVVIGAT